eukprot:GHVP01028552.1.p1 GENE.GHVP01028552.1~~GHVP01028552.1.p1  ORF type:complete len:327 (+),score=63.89 GHVP01028552.1:65-982(+)
MYEKEYPEVGEIVMVIVKQIEEIGAYVNLIEYGGIDGMILIKELSRRRIRNLQRFIRVGQTDVACVVCVDKEKGYIDLSKKSVTPEEAAECNENFLKSKAVHGIVISLSEKHKLEPLDIYEGFGWPLYKIYDHAFDAFRDILIDPEAVFAKIDKLLLEAGETTKQLRKQTQKDISSLIRQRYTPKNLKIRTDLELKCYSQEGVEGIKKSLRKAVELSTKEAPISATIIAPPLYILTLNCVDKDYGLDIMSKAIEIVGETIKNIGGELNIKKESRVVNESDETELSVLLRKSAMENAEVSGDDDSD